MWYDVRRRGGGGKGGMLCFRAAAIGAPPGHIPPGYAPGKGVEVIMLIIIKGSGVGKVRQSLENRFLTNELSVRHKIYRKE